ncbi:iron ABC transporter permease [Thermatribacter velox]|uniref:Iron ABC transporter permease n=1 Tax=Thermatribacter velox TaxID=3039681 RepID=A0ABZ2YDE3_9BACT
MSYVAGRRRQLPGRTRRESLAWSCILILGAVLLFGVLYFVGKGFVEVPLVEVWKIILGRDTAQEMWHDVVLYIRLPRILGALLIGLILGCAGCIFQALLLNPLASPYTLGVSGGAAFGGACALYLGLSNPIFPAFLGGLASLLLVLFMSGRRGSFRTESLVLAGIIVSSVFSAGVSFMKHLFGEEVGSLVFWLMGTLVGIHLKEVMWLWPFAVGIIMVGVFSAKALDVLCLGEKVARQSGVATETFRLLLLIVATLGTAAAVSVGGIIAFVGLVVPHIFRIAFGPLHLYLLPLSALGGALLLLVSDNLIRVYFGVEIPVGVWTTLIGGPFFFYLFIKRVSWREGRSES